MAEQTLHVMSHQIIFGGDGFCWHEIISAGEVSVFTRWQVVLKRFVGTEVIEFYAVDFIEDVINDEMKGNTDKFPKWYALPDMGVRLQLHENMGAEDYAGGFTLHAHPSQRLLWLERADGRVLLWCQLPDPLTNNGKGKYGLPQMRLDTTAAEETNPLLAMAARDKAKPQYFEPVGAVYHPAGGHMLHVTECVQGIEGWLTESEVAQAMFNPLGDGWVWANKARLAELAGQGVLSAATAHVLAQMGHALGL